MPAPFLRISESLRFSLIDSRNPSWLRKSRWGMIGIDNVIKGNCPEPELHCFDDAIQVLVSVPHYDHTRYAME